MVIKPGFGCWKTPRQIGAVRDVFDEVYDVPVKDFQGKRGKERQTIINDGTDALVAEMKRFKPDVILCGSRGGAWINEMMNREMQLPATVMVNAYGSHTKAAAETFGIHWELPLNTHIALIYGEKDDVFPYKAKVIAERVKTGSVGLTCCYTSKDEGHDIESMWNINGLPEVIKATYMGDFSYDVTCNVPTADTVGIKYVPLQTPNRYTTSHIAINSEPGANSKKKLEKEGCKWTIIAAKASTKGTHRVSWWMPIPIMSACELKIRGNLAYHPTKEQCDNAKGCKWVEPKFLKVQKHFDGYCKAKDCGADGAAGDMYEENAGKKSCIKNRLSLTDGKSDKICNGDWVPRT